MARKRNFKPLLDAFKPDEARPARRRCRKEIDPAIRLPSWDALLQIDAEAERQAARAQAAIPAARINAVAFGVVDAIGETSGTTRAADGRQTP